MLKSQSVTCLEFLLDTDRGADLSRHPQAHLMVPSNPQDVSARTPLWLRGRHEVRP